MRIGNIIACAAGIAGITWLAGCATDGVEAYFSEVDPKTNVFVAPTVPHVEKVAIMPFKAPTELIGTSVSDMFVTELLRMSRFELVERSQMANVLNESELALAGLSESKAAEVGNMMGADAVLIGTVDEYNNIARRGHSIPVVGISVRMIDCKSGRVLCSMDLAKRASNGDITLSEQARIVVHNMAAGLYQKWKRTRMQPKTAAASGPPGSTLSRSVPAPAAAPAAAVSSPAPLKPPAAPSGVSVTDMGLRQATLAWSIPQDPAIARYRIERADKPDGTFIGIGEAAPSRGTFTDKGSTIPLRDSTTYYYRITAVGTSGLQSPYCPVQETMTAPPPSPVTGLAARSDLIRSIPLAWTESRDVGVNRYAILRSESPAGPFSEIGTVKGASTTTYTDGGDEPGRLKDGTTYHYRIRALNEVDAVSEDHPPVSATTRPPPPAVTGLLAKDGYPREIPLSWDASPDEKVNAYILSRAEGENGEFEEIETLRDRATTSWTDRGGERTPANLGRLKDGTPYRYQIVAVNLGNSRSTPGQDAQATTKPAPETPAGVAAASGLPRKMRVRWNPNPEPDIAEYIIEGREKGAWRFREVARVKAGGGEPLEAVQEGLADNTTYEYRIKALDKERLESEWSANAQGTTKALPAAPAGLKIAWEGDQAVVSWQAPEGAGIQQYRLWKKGLLGMNSARIGETDGLTFTLDGVGAGSRMAIQVTAVDNDGLESERSEVLDIRR